MVFLLDVDCHSKGDSVYIKILNMFKGSVNTHEKNPIYFCQPSLAYILWKCLGNVMYKAIKKNEESVNVMSNK